MDYKKVLRLHFVNRLSPELSYPLPKDVTNEYIEKLL